MWADLHISLCQKNKDEYACKYLPNIRKKFLEICHYNLSLRRGKLKNKYEMNILD